MLFKFKKLLAVGLLVSTAGAALAWQPSKTIEVTIPWPVGSGNDLIFRPLAEVVERDQGVKFNISNKPGAGGTVGTVAFMTEPNDGHHINVSSIGGIAGMDHTIPSFAEKSLYDVDSFSYATMLGFSPVVIIAKNDDPAVSAQDLVKELTANKPVTIADSGGGGRLGAEAFLLAIEARKKNPNIIRVEHKGPTQTITDVAGGHVRFGVVPLSVAANQVKAGTIKILAVSSKNKIPGLENVDTMGSIVKNFEFLGTWAIILPKGASDDVLAWYANAFSKAAQEPKIKEYFKQNFFFAFPEMSKPAKLKEYAFSERARYRPIIDMIKAEKK